MKKFFMFAAMASVALASCVKNEPVATVEQGDLITFEAPVVAPSTKADPTTVDFAGTSFKVYAYYDGDNSVYINGAEVKNKKADGNIWTADKTYFWPKNNALSFVSYSPIVANAVPTPAAGNLAVAYTVPELAQEDFLVSAWTNGLLYTATTEGQVPIVFNHVLSCVKFNFAGTTDAINAVTVTGITLKGVKNSGTLNAPKAAAASWGEENTKSGNETYTLALGTGKLNGVPASTFYLLPQVLGETVKLIVNYTLPAESDAGTLAQTAEIVLGTASTLSTWAQGTRYTYTITFDVATMTFVPTVVSDDNWNVGYTDADVEKTL